MRLATKYDRDNVVNVLRNAFRENPTMQFITRKGNREKHIGRVMQYAFDFAMRRKGVFVSANGKGVAICFPLNARKKDWLDLLYQLKLIVLAMPLKRLHKIMAHSRNVAKTRPKKRRFLYVWFIGVDPTESPRVSPAEFKRYIFELARRSKLDIYAETTRRDLKVGYERLGFKVYREWYNNQSDLQVWFLRRAYNGQTAA